MTFTGRRPRRQSRRSVHVSSPPPRPSMARAATPTPTISTGCRTCPTINIRRTMWVINSIRSSKVSERLHPRINRNHWIINKAESCIIYLCPVSNRWHSDGESKRTEESAVEQQGSCAFRGRRVSACRGRRLIVMIRNGTHWCALGEKTGEGEYRLLLTILCNWARKLAIRGKEGEGKRDLL